MLRFLPLILASCSYSVLAWSTTTTTTTTTSRRSVGRSVTPTRIMKQRSLSYPTTALRMTTSSDDDPSIDGFQLTTKSQKILVFDEKTGRFFETMIGEQEESSSSSSSYQSQQQLNEDSFSSTNEMVPTEILFGKKQKSTFPHVEVAVDILASDFALREHAEDEHQQTTTTTPTEELGTQQPVTQQPISSVAEQCYNAWNQRDMTAAVNCFAGDDGFAYQDSQYVGAFTDTNGLARHFTQQANLLPSGCQLVLDEIAVDPLNGNIGTRFHVEEQDGSVVPLTSGCSFYTTSKDTGLITSGFRAMEMLVKPRKQDADRIVASASRVFANLAQQGGSPPSTSKPSSSSASISIIEQYFQAWNNRDMEAALDCFTDDCIYQTEDPVFVDTFKGKAALRDHLLKNAKVLPSSCQILLDSLAIDPTNGNIGTRWHLEISGIAVPNMQGCSMYTTDLSTGLLTSGFDVTEAPVKLPKEAMALLSLLPGNGSLFGLLNPSRKQV